VRFRIKLTVNNAQQTALLPINYTYELSAAIYRIFEHGNTEFSAFLHQKGYLDSYKQFKLFTFSKFYFPDFKIENDRIHVRSREISFEISFYPLEAIEPFIQGIFSNQRLSIGDKKTQLDFTVSGIEKLPEPKFEQTMRYKTLSPVNVSFQPANKPHALYLAPTDSRYEELLINNLKNKYIAYQKYKPELPNLPTDFVSNLQIEKDVKSKLITLKVGTPAETQIKAFEFTFALTAPVALQRMGYYAGFGEKNAMGFGCCACL